MVEIEGGKSVWNYADADLGKFELRLIVSNNTNSVVPIPRSLAPSGRTRCRHRSGELTKRVRGVMLRIRIPSVPESELSARHTELRKRLHTGLDENRTE